MTQMVSAVLGTAAGVLGVLLLVVMAALPWMESAWPERAGHVRPGPPGERA